MGSKRLPWFMIRGPILDGARSLDPGRKRCIGLSVVSPGSVSLSILFLMTCDTSARSGIRCVAIKGRIATCGEKQRCMRLRNESGLKSEHRQNEGNPRHGAAVR
jgi:hypothetical protein